MTTFGPSVNLACIWGEAISLPSLQKGITYLPGTGEDLRTGARSSSALGSVLYSDWCHLTTMWISEFAMNTSTAEISAGSSRADHGTMSSSWERGEANRTAFARAPIKGGLAMS